MAHDPYESTDLAVFGKTYNVPTDLVHAAGLADEHAPRYLRNLGLLAGHMVVDSNVEKALARTAGDLARIKTEQDAATSRQKIAEIERDTAVIRRDAACAELDAADRRLEASTKELEAAKLLRETRGASEGRTDQGFTAGQS